MKVLIYPTELIICMGARHMTQREADLGGGDVICITHSSYTFVSLYAAARWKLWKSILPLPGRFPLHGLFKYCLGHGKISLDLDQRLQESFVAACWALIRHSYDFFKLHLGAHLIWSGFTFPLKPSQESKMPCAMARFWSRKCLCCHGGDFLIEFQMAGRRTGGAKEKETREDINNSNQESAELKSSLVEILPSLLPFLPSPPYFSIRCLGRRD